MLVTHKYILKDSGRNSYSVYPIFVISVALIFFWFNFPSLWRISFSHSFKVGLSENLCFTSCGYIFASCLFLKDIFSGYRILGWQFFPFSSSSTLLYSLLTQMVSSGKYTFIQIFDPHRSRVVFSGCAFRNIYIFKILNSLIIMYLGVDFFSFILLWICWIY